jgi:hypothetical protein
MVVQYGYCSINQLLPIGNAPDIVMVFVVIGGQVEKIATGKRIVHRPIIKILYGSWGASWIERMKSDVM